MDPRRNYLKQELQEPEKIIENPKKFNFLNYKHEIDFKIIDNKINNIKINEFENIYSQILRKIENFENEEIINLSNYKFNDYIDKNEKQILLEEINLDEIKLIENIKFEEYKLIKNERKKLKINILNKFDK